jgi:CDP-diacylglycerol--glycerol-3-phosphate 3-phosphatidyltransferase
MQNRSNPAPGNSTPVVSEARDPMKSLLNVPNQITLARLVISMFFFGLLVLANHRLWDEYRVWWLNSAIILFILAATTDFLDGYLARKWNMLSSFGRVADPIVDKVFICGAFVLLTRISALVAPWIPVVLLTREFIIAGLRSYMESIGIAFGAGSGGKVKMIVQSITVPIVLFYEANIKYSDGSGSWEVSFRWLIIGLLSLTILLTLGSSLEYVFKARRLLKSRS